MGEGAMLRRLTRTGLVLAVGLVLALVPPIGAPIGKVVAAGPGLQDVPEAPAIEETILESALTGPDIFEARACPTNAASGQYVSEGFRVSVRGRCVQNAVAANLPLPAPQVSMLDNDVAIDFKVVAGAERVGLNLYARVRDSANLMSVYINVGGNKVELVRRDGGVNRTLTGRIDLKELIDPTAWNRLRCG
jgi:hypothetical protein